jgi:5,10-methylene-tetrahydrofolate dehydrogenase/methenyl tetrahydrofolate cyclohydrolase
MNSLEKFNPSVYKTTGVDLEDDIKKVTKDADIVMCVTGQENLIKADMVKEGVVVIDAGAPKAEVDFAGVVEKAAFITPVPGGIGPLTIACLFENLVRNCNKY